MNVKLICPKCKKTSTVVVQDATKREQQEATGNHVVRPVKCPHCQTVSQMQVPC